MLHPASNFVMMEEGKRYSCLINTCRRQLQPGSGACTLIRHTVPGTSRTWTRCQLQKRCWRRRCGVLPWWQRCSPLSWCGIADVPLQRTALCRTLTASIITMQSIMPSGQHGGRAPRKQQLALALASARQPVQGVCGLQAHLVQDRVAGAEQWWRDSGFADGTPDQTGLSMQLPLAAYQHAIACVSRSMGL